MTELFSIPQLDLEEHMAAARARQEETRKLAGHDHPARFCPVSLGDWIKLCQQHGVPHVPAEQVARVIREDCLYFETPGEHQQRLSDQWQKMEEAQLDRHMLRMDFASTLEIKISLSKGETAFRPEFGHIQLDDPRLFDLMMEYPRDSIPVWRRPWIDAMLQDGYPVEYRAFVRDGTLQGISSYYPQRPLPQFYSHQITVRHMTRTLAYHATPPFLWNSTHRLHNTDLDLAGVHFTADFIVNQDNKVLFLEGGPPHELGAHMCCFRPGEIGGIALTDRNKQKLESE